MDEDLDGQINEWMDGWMDGRMDGCLSSEKLFFLMTFFLRSEFTHAFFTVTIISQLGR